MGMRQRTGDWTPPSVRRLSLASLGLGIFAGLLLLGGLIRWVPFQRFPILSWVLIGLETFGLVLGALGVVLASAARARLAMPVSGVVLNAFLLALTLLLLWRTGPPAEEMPGMRARPLGVARGPEQHLATRSLRRPLLEEMPKLMVECLDYRPAGELRSDIELTFKITNAGNHRIESLVGAIWIANEGGGRMISRVRRDNPLDAGGSVVFRCHSAALPQSATAGGRTQAADLKLQFCGIIKADKPRNSVCVVRSPLGWLDAPEAPEAMPLEVEKTTPKGQ